MSRTYEGILTGNRIEWPRDAPPADRPLRVQVTLLPQDNAPATGGAAAAAALEALAQLGAFAHINDPVEWQREVRKDRPLPGRDED